MISWFLSLMLAGSVFNSTPSVYVTENELVTGQLTREVSFQEETEITEQVFAINPDGRIEVSNINGSIAIEAWDRPEVKLISKKIASTRERLADVEVKTTSSAELLRIEVDYKRWKGKWIKGDDLYVNFSLMVPRTAVLDEIESVNGSIDISGVSNVTTVSAVNGSVKATDLKGSVDLSTVNGAVVAVFKEVSSNSVISLDTVNGSAEIRVPSNVNATVKADSVNGSISNGFGLPVRKGEYVGRDLYGRIGSGASKIRLHSVNGSLKILRLDDGLQVNTVQNLLPLKTSDDFNDSFNGQLAPGDIEKMTAARAASLARESLNAAKQIESEVMRSAPAIAAEAAKLSSEAVKSALSSAEFSKLDEQRIAAELARARLNMFGNRQVPYVNEDSKSVKVNGRPTIVVEANGSNVIVRAWEKQEVKYTVSRIAHGRLSPVENIIFREEKDGIKLEVKLVTGTASNELLEQVQVEIYVPRDSDLKITTDREIRVHGVIGDLKLTGKTGSINVRDSGGSLDLSSKTALVRVIGFEGKINVQGYSGDMYLEGDFEEISSNMESGNVFLTVGDDTGALIKTNGMDAKGKTGADGKTLIVDGLRLEQKADGTWKLGKGESEFNFNFTTGKLNVRPFRSISAK